MKIVKSYKIPSGSILPTIFALPCVTAAHKSVAGEVIYHIKRATHGVAYLEYARYPGYICEDDKGDWCYLTELQYQKEQ